MITRVAAKAGVRAWVQAAILLFMGLYLLDSLLTGQINNYVNTDRFGWVPWMGTLILLALAVIRLAELLRPRPAEAADDDHNHDHNEHDHDHDHHGHVHDQAPSWLKLGLVGLPLIVGLLIPSKPLGASAVAASNVGGNFSSVQGTTTDFAVAPKDRNVLDWVRAFNGSSDVKEFTGLPADLIGFVYRDIRFDGKPQFMVARFAISCCVADATALGVIVQAKDAANWEADSWVHVTGKFDTQTIDGRATPILIADAITPTTQPDHPYLYP